MSETRRPLDSGRRDSLGRPVKIAGTTLDTRADAPAPRLHRADTTLTPPDLDAFATLTPQARRDQLAARLTEANQATRQARFVIDTALPVGVIRCVDCGRFVPEFGNMAHDCPVPKMIAAGLPEHIARELAQAGFDSTFEAHLWQTAINQLGVTAAGQWRTVGVGPYEAIRLANLDIDPVTLLPERPTTITGTIDDTRRIVTNWTAASSPDHDQFPHRTPTDEVLDHIVAAGHIIAEQIDERIEADRLEAVDRLRRLLNAAGIPDQYHDRLLAAPKLVRNEIHTISGELRSDGLDKPGNEDLYDRLWKFARDPEINRIISRYRDARAQATRAVLAEHRPLGGTLTADTTQTIRSTLAAVANMVPSDWIDHSNQHDLKLRVESVRGNGRAYYSHGFRRKTGADIEREPIEQRRRARVRTPILTDEDAEQLFRRWHPEAYDDALFDKIGNAKPRGRRYQFRGRNPRDWTWDETTGEFEYTLDSERIIEHQHTERVGLVRSANTPDTMLHELGHRLENTVPGLQTLAGAYRSRRIDPDKRIKVGRGRGEYGYEGGFAASYMGKVYPTSDTEIISCGLEAVLTGSYGGLAGDDGDRYPADPDHRAFMLGILTCAGAPE